MTIQTFLTLPAMQHLGRALVHFLWQGTLLAALYFLTSGITQSARARYAAGCAIMLAMPVVFVATVVRSEHAPALSFPQAAIQIPDSNPLDIGFLPNSETVMRPHHRVPIQPLPTRSNMAPGAVACLWLAGVLALSIFTLTGWLRVPR